MSNLSRALGWAKLGLPVFPCYEEDTWVGNQLHERKSPRSERGFLDALDDLALVEKYWTANPNHLVGVVTGQLLNVLDIDMNSEKGQDGWSSLIENEIDVPETFHVTTSSGGEHHFYRPPEGVELGPMVDVVMPNGVILQDVDRRAGGSYFIAWSDEVPNSLEALAPSPGWLCTPSRTLSKNIYHGSVEDWLNTLNPGESSQRILEAIDRIPKGDFNHQELIKRQTELVKLGAEGFAGVQSALDELKEAWLRPPFDTPENEFDWNASLAGAVNKFGGASETKELPLESDDFDVAVTKHIFKEKVRMESERRISAEFYVGSDELTFDDLESFEMSYLVDSLIPEDSICFLVAKRNVGKTFAYIDMVCSMAAGIPWLGKTTRQAKTTIVLGEGRNGFIDRLKAWCEQHSFKYEDLRPWLSFVDGANLNSDVSIDKIRKVTQRERSELIIFDTWSNTSGVSKEEDGALNSLTMNRAIKIQNGAALLFVHHPNKATQDSDAPVMRGSGSLEGRADVVMTMYLDKKHISPIGEKQKWIALSTEMDHQGKNRSAETETFHGLYLASVADSKVLVRSVAAGVSSYVHSVLTHMKDGMTTAEFSIASKQGDSTARRALKDAEKEGFIYISSPAAGKKPAQYSFVEGKKPVPPDWNQLREISKLK